MLHSSPNSLVHMTRVLRQQERESAADFLRRMRRMRQVLADQCGSHVRLSFHQEDHYARWMCQIELAAA